MRHPGLPRVLEVGETAGFPYLVMELARGRTLADHLAGQSLDELRTVELAYRLLATLAAVHDAGLIHRDVKPRNILIDDVTGDTVLVDFGFATPIERVAQEDIAGTAAYAAPEQLTLPGRVDGRADLFALGRVLFECLAGAKAVEVVGSALAARTRLVSQGVDPALADIVAALLRDDPEERYPDAHAVVSDLDRVLNGGGALGPAAYQSTRVRPKACVRRFELAKIVVQCERAEAFVVEGPRGSGRSNLLASAVVELRLAEKATVDVRTERDDAPFATIRRLVESLVRRLPADAGDVAGNLAPVASLVAPRLASRFGPEMAAVGTEALPEGVAELILRLLRGTGVRVLFVDDAQWLDHASADALERLAYRLADAGAALGLFMRSDDVPSHVDRLREVASGDHRTWRLGALSREQLAEVIATHLGGPPPSELVSRVSLIADGMPLAVHEVLATLHDECVLLPFDGSWKYDAIAAEKAALPSDIVALLARRIDVLPLATQRVLETAAAIGSRFDDALLAKTFGITTEDLDFATSSAIRAGVLVHAERGAHAFVHESLRELLVERVDAVARRTLHRKIAEQMDVGNVDADPEQLFRLAHHYAQSDSTSRRSFATAMLAAEQALARFDNETALVLLEHARRTVRLTDERLGPRFHCGVGEAQLRLGRLEESLDAFQAALAGSTRATGRATVLGRIAWVYQVRAEPERAWDALDRAFTSIGARMPVESVGSAAKTTLALVRARVARRAGSRERAEILCALHYQNARLGLEYGKPFRLLQSSIESNELAKTLDEGRVQLRSAALHGFVVAALKMRRQGASEIAEAKARSEKLGDYATTAFCVQIQSVAACFSDDLEEAMRFTRECIDVYGPWLELNEFLFDVSNGVMIETARGRPGEAWRWIELALARLRRSRTRTYFFDYVIHCARATLAALGQENRDDPWLTMQLAATSPQDRGQGFHALLSWAPRVRYYVERGDLGPSFEAVVSAFEKEGHNPASVHLVLIEYFVSVAHARMHQCIRADRGERARHVAALRRATSDLTAASKALRVMRAHAQLAEGCLAWLEGDDTKATKLLASAEALAVKESAPWVLYSVARTRAHMLRDGGKADAARDHARMAEVLASEHGAVMRARWIREEFALVVAPLEASPVRSTTYHHSSRTSRQLSALLAVARAPRLDLRVEDQSVAVLDELVHVLQGAGATLFFVPDPAAVPIYMARRKGKTIPVAPDRSKLLRDVHDAGAPWPPIDALAAPLLRTITAPADADVDRIAVVPLHLYERAVGAIAVERSPETPPFSAEDRNLLVLLSDQVPIALEIARLLFEREQLHASLQHAKKMEAMGALAGGLAHDFNNMLAAVRVALGAAQERAAHDEEMSTELDIIAQATTRAAQLTGQLLSFSRHQPVPVSVHEVNGLISSLEPMLRRVIGARVDLQVNLSSAVDAVEVDQGSFDQALVNLLINARDAMPKGGKITVSTRNVILADSAAQRANVPAGEYVEIEIADTGEGMTPETMTRIFEPFFTTKAVGSGSGLGLAMVYAFARNCGGSIDVESTVGVGTKFRIYLRRVDRVRALRSVRPTATPVPGAMMDDRDTILVVDDDDLVRRSISKILERNGYRVVVANSPNEALRVVGEEGDRIGLVILDVLMPGTSGPELGRRFGDLKVPAKLLYVSGFSPETIPFEDAQVAADMLLQKPFSQTTLLERVRQLMGEAPN